MNEIVSKNDLLKDMGDRYLAARKRLGWTQEQSAEAGDTTQQSISDAERGSYFLAPDVMLRLCLAYGISVDYLMLGSLSDADMKQEDPRAKQLNPEQFFHYKAMNDHFFESHGITIEHSEDS